MGVNSVRMHNGVLVVGLAGSRLSLFVFKGPAGFKVREQEPDIGQGNFTINFSVSFESELWGSGLGDAEQNEGTS